MFDSEQFLSACFGKAGQAVASLGDASGEALFWVDRSHGGDAVDGLLKGLHACHKAFPAMAENGGVRGIKMGFKTGFSVEI